MNDKPEWIAVSEREFWVKYVIMLVGVAIICGSILLSFHTTVAAHNYLHEHYPPHQIQESDDE